MDPHEILDALGCFNLKTASLALQRPENLRQYVSFCSKRYDELAGKGLPDRSPVTPAKDLTITLPAYHAGGGMSFTEMVVLARTTRSLKPRTIFEMGTYNGLSTAVFMLNSESDCRVFTLDLPPHAHIDRGSIFSDKQLVSDRDLASVPRMLGLQRYTQLLCDSMAFDPSPYENSVELGLVDAAHDVEHARNDTIKMARMMTDEGIVFWHDYGGKGVLRPLASYLEKLAKRSPIYRVSETTLAWAPARELKLALLERAGDQPQTLAAPLGDK